MEKRDGFLIHDRFEAYLESSPYIDWEDPWIIRVGKSLTAGDEVETARRAYRFVRDEIKHSWDAQDRRVTAKASQVLRQGVGICWAKSNLLAALLRVNEIPAGICYQQLTLGDTPESGYCVHALNAAYLLPVNRWVRMDARGNKPGVRAEFSLEEERLAFPVREELGEADERVIYARPLASTMEVLEASTDALYMYLHNLPDTIK